VVCDLNVIQVRHGKVSISAKCHHLLYDSLDNGSPSFASACQHRAVAAADVLLFISSGA
jgi:hypothetical protein